ncbi:MAG: KAP family NTPase, partial [Mariprofundaceae bacterium]|nr:KAP family NTPase [Mariprofundaceae bacterium]
KDKSIKAIKTISRVGARVGIKVLTAGVLDETVFEDTKTIKDVAGEASELLDNYVKNRLEGVEQDKKTLVEFKLYLETLSKNIGADHPLVFIIDELDRCKPPFALKTLEIVKHLFSVPNIVFVLVMNRTQIEESIRCEYGQGVDASLYLQKFVGLWAHLPKLYEGSSSDSRIYMANALDRMEFNAATRDQLDGKEILEELSEHYNLSLRSIERSLTNFSIIQNAYPNLEGSLQILVAYLSIVKAIYPDVYKKLAKNKITYDELIIETEIQDLRSRTRDDFPDGHILKWMLRSTFYSGKQIQDYMAQQDISDDTWIFQCNAKSVCKWMDSFEVK